MRFYIEIRSPTSESFTFDEDSKLIFLTQINYFYGSDNIESSQFYPEMDTFMEINKENLFKKLGTKSTAEISIFHDNGDFSSVFYTRSEFEKTFNIDWMSGLVD